MRSLELEPGEGLLPLFLSAKGMPGRVLLESVRKQENAGRYSIFGYNPTARLTAVRGGVEIATHGGGVERRAGDPWTLFCAWIRGRSHGTQAGALPVYAGAIGHVTYEAGLAWEGVRPAVEDDAGPAPLCFAYYEGFLVFDELDGRLWATADTGSQAGDEAVLGRLRADVEAWRGLPQDRPDLHCSAAPGPWEDRFDASFGGEAYAQAVARVREYIASGDVYQVNLAQHFSAPWAPGREDALYCALRRISPAPYASFLDVGGGVVSIGCSPELFLQVRDGRVSTRPIKGTRPRGADTAEDAVNRRELLESDKDRAELLMIVDLERNDLGRVCETGSISVRDLYTLEEHPTVFHLVAEVTGRLGAGRDALDLIRASFPGGSITGAPKIRAMQVISELEPVARGVYTGAVGYLGSRGECTLNIAIRTIQCRGNRVHFHAGSGIVWDSECEAEHHECLAKGRAMAEAILRVNPAMQ